MRSVKLLTDHLDPERAAADRWYVSNGVTAVGPVNTDLLARGIEAGKVPMESFVRHEAWKVWRPLSEIAVVTGGEGAAAEGDASVELSKPDAITLEVQTSFEALSNPSLSPGPATEPGWPSMGGEGEGDAERDAAWARSQAFQDSSDDLTPQGIPPFRPPLASVSEPDFAIFTPPPPPPDPADNEGPLPAPPLLAPLVVPAISAPSPSSAPATPAPAIPGLSAPAISDPAVTVLSPRAISAPPITAPSGAARPPFETPSDARPTPRLGSEPPRAAAPEPTASLSDTLLLLLSAAAERASAEVAIVHHVRDDGAIVVCAHGPRMLDILGKRTPLTDPAIMAAASGLSIVTEPSPGPAGQTILARLTDLGAPAVFALMIPLRPGGRLYGVLEMGRPTPFTPSEVAEVGQLAAEAVARIEAAHLA